VPDDDHGDPRQIVLSDLAAAANANGTSPEMVAATVSASLLAATAPEVVLVDSDGIAKAGSEPQRYVLGVAYQPGQDPRIAKGLDGGRDFFTEEELEKAAWSFLRNGPRVGMFHVDGTDQNGGAATVVESYVWRGPDWDLGDGIVVTKGTWLIGAILDERAWDLKQAGKLNGFSPQGVARRRHARATP
jgi:hypothetical protein